MMWLRLLDQTALRALTGGILYALLVMSVDRIARLVERSMRARHGGAATVRYSRLWAVIAHIAAVLAATGFIFALLLEGTFAANDIGIVRINWPMHGPWLAVLMPGTIALIAFFWGPYFAKPFRTARPQETQARGPENLRSRVLLHDDQSTTLFDALTDEASLTIFRAASIPLLGTYWGIWFGLAWSLATRFIYQRQRPIRMSPDRRGFYYLAGALDWLSATLFVVTGSLWACLLGRLVSHAAAQLVYRWSIRHRLYVASGDPIALASDAVPVDRALTSASGEDERQDDERGEHDRRQDGDALQVT